MAGLLSRETEHEQVEVLLSVYLDGRTSRAERALVERHLTSCAECARNLATLRTTVAAVRAMPRIRAPRSFALPRTMAKQPATAPWLYPMLRAATAVATFLFVITVAGDLSTRSTTLPMTAYRYSAPATTLPTPVAMQSVATSAGDAIVATVPVAAPPRAVEQPSATFAPQRAAPATRASPSAAGQPAAPPAPQKAAPAAPAPTAEKRAVVVLTSTSTSQVLSLEAAPGTSTPANTVKLLETPITPVEPPTEEPLRDEGMGSRGLGGVGQAPGALSVTPTRSSMSQVIETATVQPTPAPPTAAPTQIAGAPAPQPPPARVEPGGAYQIARPTVNPFRIAEGVLAVVALALGVAAWVACRRSR